MAIDAPTIEKRPWEWSSGPFYIGLFLWVVFFDQIPKESTANGGVLWSSLGVLLGGVLATLLFYRVPAKLGFETGRPLPVVATSTFGVSGASWVPGRILLLTYLGWIAISTYYAADLCLQSLVIIGFLEPKWLAPTVWGTWTIHSPLFLLTALAWSFAASFTGIYLIRVIAQLMNVFEVLPAVLIGVCAARAFGGLPGFVPLPNPFAESEWQNHLESTFNATQMVLGYFAVSGLASVDWGAVLPSKSDVDKTGVVGVGFASTTIGVLAILTVAGAIGGMRPSGDVIESSSYTFAKALPLLFGPGMSAFVLMVFGLTALAPTCYAAYLFGTRMGTLAPRKSSRWWTGSGAFLAWLLVLLNLPGLGLFFNFGLLGAMASPILGAITADTYVAAGSWRGPRKGFNLAGFGAVGVGWLVGLVPTVARLVGRNQLGRLQPSTLFAFVAAFVVYFLLAKLGLESKTDEHPELIGLATSKTVEDLV